MRATTRLVILGAATIGAVSFAIVPTTHRPAPVSVAAVTASVEESPLPVWRHPPLAAAPKPAPPATVTVVPGDTLAGIAARLSRTWQQLAGWNHLSWPQAQAIVVGQVLAIPAAGYVPPRYVPPAPPSPPIPARAAPARPPVVVASSAGPGVYGYAALESLWVAAAGPAWAAPRAAQIALCESGGRPWAHNPSGATGLWQILGQVVAGDLFSPMVNAENAVSKFHGSGDTFAQWVCQ